MALSISQSQKKNIDFLETTGESVTKFDLSGLEKVLADSFQLFVKNWGDIVNQKQIIASGDIETNLEFDIIEESDGVRMQIRIPEYSKFVDKGVKGLKSSKKAPKSPYKFKTWGMSAEGRASVNRWLQSGKAKTKVSDIKKYGAVGYEKKSTKNPQQAKLDRVVSAIKAGGIETRNFIDPTIKKSFKDLNVKIAREIGRQVTIQITR